jgi:hypothetical protein
MDLAISGVTLSGSLLSSAAVAFIIIRYFWPYKSHPFRNALVINLLFASTMLTAICTIQFMELSITDIEEYK